MNKIGTMTLLGISLSKMTSMGYHFIVNRINKWTESLASEREKNNCHHQWGIRTKEPRIQLRTMEVAIMITIDMVAHKYIKYIDLKNMLIPPGNIHSRTRNKNLKTQNISSRIDIVKEIIALLSWLYSKVDVPQTNIPKAIWSTTEYLYHPSHRCKWGDKICILPKGVKQLYFYKTFYPNDSFVLEKHLLADKEDMATTSWTLFFYINILWVYLDSILPQLNTSILSNDTANQIIMW